MDDLFGQKEVKPSPATEEQVEPSLETEEKVEPSPATEDEVGPPPSTEEKVERSPAADEEGAVTIGKTTAPRKRLQPRADSGRNLRPKLNPKDVVSCLPKGSSVLSCPLSIPASGKIALYRG